jgi:6-phosphofructokinase 1
LPFDPEAFLEDVKGVLQKQPYCLVVVSEGLVDADNNYVAQRSGFQDQFGHTHLGGVGEYLQALVEERLGGVKARSCKLGTAQRCAAHWGSKVDNDEAFWCGQAAVRFLMQGHTQEMVTLVRSQQDNAHTEVGVVPLAEVANGVKPFPRQWLNEDGSIGHAFIKYAYPLIQGEVPVLCEHGLPHFEDLDMQLVSPRKEIKNSLFVQAAHGT